MPDSIPELSLQDFVTILKGFGVYAELPEDSRFAVRLVGTPYNSFVPDCKSIRIMAHNRGTMVSPLVIKQVLEKFAIAEMEFLEILARSQGAERPGASPPPIQ